MTLHHVVSIWEKAIQENWNIFFLKCILISISRGSDVSTFFRKFTWTWYEKSNHTNKWINYVIIARFWCCLWFTILQTQSCWVIQAHLLILSLTNKELDFIMEVEIPPWFHVPVWREILSPYDQLCTKTSAYSVLFWINLLQPMLDSHEGDRISEGQIS